MWVKSEIYCLSLENKGNTVLSLDNPRLRRSLSFDYFRRKEGKPAEKIQLERINFSLLFWSPVIVTLKSQS